MTKNNNSSGRADELRKRAEDIAAGNTAHIPENIETLPPAEINRILHELQLHQIELEMQNEELRRTHTELENSRARYFDLYDLAPVGYIAISEKGLIIEANITAAGLLGLTRSELAKQPLTRFILPDDQDIYYRHRKQLFETGEPQVCEFRMTRNDGCPFWARVNTTAALDSEGAPVCRAVMTDITERKETEVRLIDSEQKYRTLFEHNSDGLLIADIQTKRFHYANQKMCEMLGYTMEELLTLGLNDIHPEKDIAYVISQFEKQAKKEILVAVNIPCMRKDGTVFFADINTTPLEIDGRHCNMGMFRDITERMRAEEFLRERERFLTAIIENFPGPLSRVDRNLRYLFANSKYEEWFGKTPESMLGHTIPEVIGEDAFKNAEPHARRALAGERVTFESIITSPSGKVSHAQVTFVPDLGPDGNCEGFFTAVTDITARKQAEEALRHSEEQLRQSQKMEAVGRLAGGVAHDFNNMLVVINGNAEMAINAITPDDPLRKDLEEILKAGRRSAELTRQLLAFSRRQVLAPKILDMNKTITGIESMLRRIIGEDIKLKICPAPGPCIVKADPGQIEQVIMNLAVNSRDAMPKGGKLTIETANVELDEEGTSDLSCMTPGMYVVLSITDTGSGMDAVTKESIFEPFFTTKAIGEGTGLGLSTVYGTVKQSGGNIRVYSEPGHGTTFNIYLPRDLSDTQAAPHKSITHEFAKGTETILVVEDEPGVRNIVQRLLESSGYTVHTAASGGEALLICEREGGTIQLMITDIVMPGMNGRELAERLAKICTSMKTLYMSGYTEDTVVHHAVKDEKFNFISKPFSVPDFINKVRSILDGK